MSMDQFELNVRLTCPDCDALTINGGLCPDCDASIPDCLECGDDEDFCPQCQDAHYMSMARYHANHDSVFCPDCPVCVEEGIEDGKCRTGF